MPLGGAGLGLNVWFEEGELLIYFQQNGNFDEHGGFPKQGRLRISFPQEEVAQPEEFIQTLNTEIGCIDISLLTEDLKLDLHIWVNMFHPDFHVEIHSSREVPLSVQYENWRFEDRVSPAENSQSSIFGERHDIFAYWMYPHDLVRHQDHIDYAVQGGEQAIRWYHRNDNSDLAYDKEMDQQGFSELKADFYNPQKDLVYGGLLWSRNLIRGDVRKGHYLGKEYRGYSLLTQKPQRETLIHVCCHQGQYRSLRPWKEALSGRAAQSENDYETNKINTESWWSDLWDRSYIDIQPNTDNDALNEEVRQVSRNYRLFRFMLAFNFGGDYPLKFNGGLNTYDSGLVFNIEDQRQSTVLQKRLAREQDDRQTVNQATDKVTLKRDFGPDYRAWGGMTLTQQNQRLIYWPLLKSGDHELMKPQFDWFVRALPAAEKRTELAWGHDGASFTEQVNPFGIPLGSHFGWGRPREMGLGNQISDPCQNHYSTQLEFAWMILQFHQYSGLDIGPYLDFILSGAEFFFKHYPVKENRLEVFPSTALESYKEAKNPLDVTCALRRVYGYLLKNNLLPASKEKTIKERLDQIPPIRFRDVSGKTCIAPAESWERIINVELPQMYPVFPYRLFGVGMKHLGIAINTWKFACDEVSGQKSYASWHQDGIFCANMGLVDEAGEILIQKLSDSGRRFPAFWGPGHDWVPDFNWGGTGMIQLQDMLLQEREEKILLLPCWPENWDVRFKLHGPLNTIVRCEYRNGKVVQLTVEPESRRKDVRICDGEGCES
jgi:hypothetical protein